MDGINEETMNVIKVKVIRSEIANAKTKKKTKDDMVKTIMKIIKDEVRKSMRWGNADVNREFKV